MENEIKEFFRQTAPKPADSTSFTLELNARLAAIEQVKAFHDREIRRVRRNYLIALVAGLLLGGTLATFLILHPVQLPDIYAWAETPEHRDIVFYISVLLGGLVIRIALLLPRRLSRRRSSLL